MDSLDEWQQYLLGAEEPVEIWTDHQNLQYFRKPQKLNRRQAVKPKPTKEGERGFRFTQVI